MYCEEGKEICTGWGWEQSADIPLFDWLLNYIGLKDKTYNDEQNIVDKFKVIGVVKDDGNN